MLKKFSTITSFNICTQIISLIGFTLITRLFSPEIIGQYLVYLSFTAIYLITSTGFYEQVFFLEKDESRYPLILSSIICIFLLSSLFAIPAIYLYESNIWIIPFIICSAFFGAMKVLIVSYAISRNRIIALSIIEMILSPILPLMMFFVYLFINTPTAYEMLIVNTVVTGLTVIVLWGYFLRFYFFKFISEALSCKYSVVINFMKEYIDLPKHKMTSEFAGVLALRLPVIFIANYFSTSASAYYGIALRIAMSPIMIVTKAVSQMYMQEYSLNKKQSQSSKNTFYKFTKLLLLLASGFIFAVFMFSEFVITLIFGNEYREVSHYLKFLAPYMFVLISVSPLLSTFVIERKISFLTRIKFTFLITTITSYFIGGMNDNVFISLALFSVFSLLVYLYAYIKIYNIHNA
jgi:O-antigen/teichoic acid export membrane protein